MSVLSDLVAKFRKGSPNIAAAFDEVERRLVLLEQAQPSPEPVPTLVVTSRAQWDAMPAPTGGEVIHVQGVTFDGQVNIHWQPASLVTLRFAADVRFRGGGPRDLNAVWVRARNLAIEGGDMTNPTGHGLLVHDSTNVRWHGFKVWGVGGSCLRVFTVAADCANLDFEGDVSGCGGDLTLDPHAEKGTGLHPSYIGGGDPGTAWRVRDSRFVVTAHDCPSGSNQIGPKATGCEFVFRAYRLTKVATQQVAGNAAQLFGDLHDLTLDVEGVDLAGRVVETNALASSSSGVWVSHGRGTRVRLVPMYAPHAAVTYTDCS